MCRFPEGRSLLRLQHHREEVTSHPQSDQSLWKYMDFPKFVSMLDHDGLYFAVLASMPDKLEGAPRRLPAGTSDSDCDRARLLFERLTRAAFVNCWHLSDDESAAMWRLYGCVAIQTTYERLISATTSRLDPALAEYNRVSDGLVEYVNPDVETKPERWWKLFQAVLSKRGWYAHEHEFRLIYFDRQLFDGPVSNYSSQELDSEEGRARLLSQGACSLRPLTVRGRWVRCSLDVMIRQVVVAPDSAPYIEEAVKAVCSRWGLSPDIVKRSRIEEKPPLLPALCALDGGWA
jgi:hypothetical protein